MASRNWNIPPDKLAAISLLRPLEQDATQGETVSFLAQSGLFDADWYLREYHDVLASGVDPITHYILHGYGENRDPAPWFDTRLYVQENPDVQASGQNPFIHYLLYGWGEGRRSNQQQEKKTGRLIISLTSWPARIRTVDVAIASIMRQSMKPDKIILWLAEAEFPLRERQLPLELLAQVEKGLEIRWCENIGSYKKLVPALREFPNDIIVTCDDDIELEQDWLDKLWQSYKKRPNCIHCHRATKIIFGDGIVHWQAGGKEYYKEPSFLNKQTGCKGVLYPPHALHKDTLRQDLFMRLAPSSDDVWFWAMALLNSKKVAVCDDCNIGLKYIGATQDVSLCKKNDGPDMLFERHFQNVFFFYRHELGEILNVNIYEQFLTQKIKDWYKRCTGQNLDLKNCATYNEKIQWQKLYDDNPIKSKLADKLLARDYVRSLIGDRYLPKLYGAWSNFDQINFAELPNQFVLKANHGCAWNILVKDKNCLDKEDARAKFARWLNTNFAFHEGFETHYFDIAPMIICEEYLDAHAGAIDDYKIFCFHGKPAYIMYLSDRDTQLKMDFYDLAWNRQNFRYTYPPCPTAIAKPPQLELMLNLAGKLAQGFPHVRVDFYILSDGHVKFGEFTFSSASGVCKWYPSNADAILGSLFLLN